MQIHRDPGPPGVIPELFATLDQEDADPAALGNERGDEFGHAIATGDFDCDDDIDLAVGILHQTGGGAVAVFWADESGWYSSGPVVFPEPGVPYPDFPLRHVWFGHSLASGDFDADGCDDLAIGDPQAEADAGRGASGWVVVRYGDSEHPFVDHVQQFGQQTVFVPDLKGDFFGASLASGDFDADAFDDLAIGAPGRDDRLSIALPPIPDRGFVHVRHGTTAGLDLGSRAYAFDVQPCGDPIAGMQFGRELAAGRLDWDEYDDLAISAPEAHAGDGSLVYLRRGGTGGLLSDWTRCNSVPSAEPRDGDHFGHSLAICDVNADDRGDVIIGNPYLGNDPLQAGSVEVLSPVRGRYWFASGYLPALAIAEVITQPMDDPLETLPVPSFGWSVACGRFSEDNYDDIAIGAPTGPMPGGMPTS